MRELLNKRKSALLAALAAMLLYWLLLPGVSQQHWERISDSPDPVLRTTPLGKTRAGPYSLPDAEEGIVEIYEPDGVHGLEDPRTDVPPIILKIPERFRGNGRRGGRRDWGLNLLTYYPGFTSPREPENAKFGLSCAGYCNGRILITIENGSSFRLPDTRGNRYNAKTHADYIARHMLEEKKERQWPQHYQPNLHTTDLEPQAGFGIVFEELWTKMEDAPNVIPEHYTEIMRYYLRKNQEGEYFDLVVSCHVPSGNNTYEPFTCTLHFSLACNPAVSVEVTGVDGKFVPEFDKIQTETDRFVSAMLVKPQCGS
ncbi:MAG: hypothetical protein ACLP7P_05780 [Rhodomicrobium sp.]